MIVKKGIKYLSINIFAVITCLVFLLICFYYSSKINLWGDEAYSLQLAEKSWREIFANFDVHFPTYYFFLKLLVSVLGDSKEIFLRLAHSILFAVGLFFGYKTILLLSGSQKKSLLVLLAAIITPSFVFYATNLRMYAPLFLFSMLYIFALSSMLLKNASPTKKEWALYFIVAALLVLTDYPGIVVFLVGSGLFFFKFAKLRKWNYPFLAISPLASLLIYYSRLIPEIGNILTWPTNSGSETDTITTNLFEVAKWAYESFRPVFDLLAPSQKYLLLALVLPAVFALGLLISFVFLILKKGRGLTLNVFVVACFAFYWIVLIPVGESLTRSFLPSLFFMPAFLILANRWLPKAFFYFNIILFALLILSNFFQVLSPTLRLYSVIPYKVIASDAGLIAEKENIKHIFFSENSLNSLSIKRYLEKSNPQKFDTSWVPPNSKVDPSVKEDFLFVSHMGENNGFVDYKAFTNDYQVRNVKNYIKLDDLPYNTFWLEQTKERAFQEYAVSVYVVRKR